MNIVHGEVFWGSVVFYFLMTRSPKLINILTIFSVLYHDVKKVIMY